MKKLNISVYVSDLIDLDHMLESVSDATFISDNVTQNEQLLLIHVIQQLIKENDKNS